ncbi:MAG: hypothetical protein V5A36_05185, partial [Natronomonas sp.]
EKLHALGIELTDGLNPALSQPREVDDLTARCLDAARRLDGHVTETAQPESPSAVFETFLREPIPDKPFGDEHWELPKWSAELETTDIERAITNLVNHFEASEIDLLTRVCAQGGCEFGMPTSAKGGYMYVRGIKCPACDAHARPDADICAECGTKISDDDRGYERVPCQHPSESATVRNVLGSRASDEFVDEHTGFNAYCLCLACNAQFERDLDRDGRRCPACVATEVYTEREMVGKSCPACEIGIVVERFTGTIT